MCQLPLDEHSVHGITAAIRRVRAVFVAIVIAGRREQGRCGPEPGNPDQGGAGNDDGKQHCKKIDRDERKTH